MNDKQLKLPVSQGAGFVAAAGQIIGKAVLAEDEGTYYAINPNAILTINCTASCNADCFFCYNRQTFIRAGTYVSAEHPCLERAIRLARKAGIWRAGLSGGEPTLHPKELLSLAEKLKKSLFSQIRLHTNGLLLEESVSYKGEEAPLYAHLRNAGITDISISVVDYRPDRNTAVMGIDNITRIRAVLPALLSSGIHVRFSCFLCPEGLNDADEVEKYLRWGLTQGVRQFIFRVPPNPENAGPALLEALMLRLQKRGCTLIYSHHKSDSVIYELESPDVRISLSCADEEPDPDQKIRRLIYMPDNVLYTSWIDPASYLYDDDAERLVKNALTVPALPSPASGAAGIDLHVHSLVSDGLLTPTDVLRRAADAGICSLVFTEHNCLHSSPLLLRKEAEKLGLDLPLFGIEFSTVYVPKNRPRLKFHVLVYAKHAEQLDFRSRLYDPNLPRNAHICRLYAAARAAGVVNRTLEDIYAIHDPAAPSEKFMLTRALLAREIATTCGCSEEEAREIWLPQIPDEERYRSYIDCRELIRLAHENGCAVILAHPGWIRAYKAEEFVDETALFLAITELARLGLDGIEVYHRLNSEDMRAKLLSLARTLELIVTGGSDFHGKPRCVFRENGTTEEQLERLLARIRYRGASK